MICHSKCATRHRHKPMALISQDVRRQCSVLLEFSSQALVLIRGHIKEVHESDGDGGENKSLQSVFPRIYKTNMWGNRETLSGDGSTLVRIAVTRECLNRWIKEKGVRTVLDVPCGDTNWQGSTIASIADGIVTYYGYDIAPEAIERSRGSRQKNKAHDNIICISVFWICQIKMSRQHLRNQT